MKPAGKKKSKQGQWYFLALVVLAYLVIFLIDAEKAFSALRFFKEIFINLLPIFGLIFLIMTLVNYFIKPDTLRRYLGESSGIKGLLISIISGIISSGPIYMWYPLLAKLKKEGMKIGLIATFLYARAFKIPMIPLLIAYFGLPYSVILLSLIIIFSVIHGWTTESLCRLLENKPSKKIV